MSKIIYRTNSACSLYGKPPQGGFIWKVCSSLWVYDAHLLECVCRVEMNNMGKYKLVFIILMSWELFLLSILLN